MRPQSFKGAARSSVRNFCNVVSMHMLRAKLPRRQRLLALPQGRDSVSLAINSVFRRSNPKLKVPSWLTFRATFNPKKVLPEQLVIYHAGTGRIVFLAFLKITTVVTCAFFCLVAAPGYARAEKPYWQTAGCKALLSKFTLSILSLSMELARCSRE
jgi:hypothetical protein